MGFEPRLVMSNVRLTEKIRRFGEASMLEVSGTCALTLLIVPGHWPYNCRKKHSKYLS
jgi:hypothetical protein